MKKHTKVSTEQKHLNEKEIQSCFTLPKKPVECMQRQMRKKFNLVLL